MSHKKELQWSLIMGKALRTHMLRLLGPKTIYYEALGFQL